MMSKFILFAFLVVVCFRNSSGDNAFQTYVCSNDQEVLNTLKQLEQLRLQKLILEQQDLSVPIIVVQGVNPMDNKLTEDCIKASYTCVIIVNNTNNRCSITDYVLNQGKDCRTYPSLYMMNKARLLKKNQPLIDFNPTNLQKIRLSVSRDNNRQLKDEPYLSIEIEKRLNRETNNRTLNQGPNQAGNQPRPPVRILPGPILANPPYGTTHKRNFDQIQVSGQPRPPTNIQMTAAMMEYQNFQMMRSSVSDQGQNSGQGQSSGHGQGSGQPRPQTNTPMMNYQSFPATIPNTRLPTIPIQSTPKYLPTLFKPKAEYAIPRGPDRTQNLLIRMENQEGRGNNLAGSSHREKTLDGSHLTLFTNSNDDCRHKDKKSKYEGESTSSKKWP